MSMSRDGRELNSQHRDVILLAEVLGGAGKCHARWYSGQFGKG
jgi:hypothetical protein